MGLMCFRDSGAVFCESGSEYMQLGVPTVGEAAMVAVKQIISYLLPVTSESLVLN